MRRRFESRTEPTNPWVFPGRDASGHVTDPKDAWHRICKAAKIEGATIHDLRRTRASYMALGGASLLQIGNVLVHRSAASTEIYGRLNQQAAREAQAVGTKKMRAMMLKAQKAEKHLQTRSSAAH